MNKLGKNKSNWLKKQGCIFKEDCVGEFAGTTSVWTSFNEYVGLADLGNDEKEINFIYKNRLTNLMSINRAKGLPLSKYGCNAVSIGFNEKEQAWYGWTHRGFSKFYIGYEVKEASILDIVNHKYPFKVETLEQAKELAADIADYLD